jgi:hypothetical protein
MRCRVIGDAIPFQVFQDALPFKAGSFTVIPAKAGIQSLRKPESSHFNSFWTPAFAGVTGLGLFTKQSKLSLKDKEVLMRKYFFCVALILILAGSPALAEELKVGMKAPDWSYKDAAGKVYTMESWSGKVLLVNYVDPDAADLNEHFTDAMKKASDEKRLKKEHYKGNCREKSQKVQHHDPF